MVTAVYHLKSAVYNLYDVQYTHDTVGRIKERVYSIKNEYLKHDYCM